MLPRPWAAALAGLLCASAFAEPPNPPAFTPLEAAPAVATPLKAPGAPAATLALPALGEALRKRSAEALAPHEIGFSRRADVEAQPRLDQSRLRWQPAAGGVAAQLRIRLPGAAAIRAGLRFERFPKGLELRVAEVAADGSLRVVALVTAAELSKRHRGVLPLEHWTPSTAGEEQVIELWARAAPAAHALRFHVFDASHLLRDPWAEGVQPKVFLCHVDSTCIADAAVQQERRAVARMSYVKAGRTALCTGALLNDRAASQSPLFATAHHCIATQEVASTLETGWFFFSGACNGLPAAATRQFGGATLLAAYGDSDFSLLRLNESPPGGATFLGWNPAPLATAQAVHGLHHPGGSHQRYMGGTYLGPQRVREEESPSAFPDLLTGVRMVQGILEGGSSGSPLITAPSEFRGTLMGGPATNACGGASNSASYSDFSLVYPVVRHFLAGPGAVDTEGDSAQAAVDAPTGGSFSGELNRAGDVDFFRLTLTSPGELTLRGFDLTPGAGTDTVGTLYAPDGATVLATSDDRLPNDLHFEIAARIPAAGTYYLAVRGAPGAVGAYGVRAGFAPPDDHANTSATATPLAANGTGAGFLGSPGDEDWFRIAFDRSGTFEVHSTGATDVFSRLYFADGTTFAAENDDANPPDTNFGLSMPVQAGTVAYLRVTGFDGATGAYGLVTTLRTAAEMPANYTDLWWNPAESGWGLNLNHQGDILFGTLFTYAADGRDMWLVASSLPRQPDGRYTGALYRLRGPAFNASPWGSTTLSEVGTMTLAFAGIGRATLTYSVNGTTVVKAIERQPFAAPPPTCSFTVASRETAGNYQDLWWNFTEPGWGLNVAHHGDVLFATLFTYAADGRDMWLVASNLQREPAGSFAGPLYRLTGPPFNASPWPGVSLAEVGNMRLEFHDGFRGTLTYTVNNVGVTKAIRRQVFSPSASLCR